MFFSTLPDHIWFGLWGWLRVKKLKKIYFKVKRAFDWWANYDTLKKKNFLRLLQKKITIFFNLRNTTICKPVESPD
jgi:hypothetical protein